MKAKIGGIWARLRCWAQRLCGRKQPPKENLQAQLEALEARVAALEAWRAGAEEQLFLQATGTQAPFVEEAPAPPEKGELASAVLHKAETQEEAAPAAAQALPVAEAGAPEESLSPEPLRPGQPQHLVGQYRWRKPSKLWEGVL